MRIAGTMFIAGLLALSACKGPASVQDANAKVATFHQRLDAGDFEAIWKDTGADMKIATRKEDFAGLLGRVHEQLGKVRESKQTGWQTRVDNSGSFAELTMNTTFERGGAYETFIYKNTDDDRQLLAGYHIKPSD
jgi:hypothetical protein